jgi:hypothetical protein
MNTRIKTRCFTACILMIFVAVTFVFGQERAMDQKRLNRDLKIMEGILEKLLQGKSSTRHFDGDTKGLYLDGFGIVFHSNQGAFGHTRLILSDQFEEGQFLYEQFRGKSNKKTEVVTEVVPDKAEEKDEVVVKVGEADAKIAGEDLFTRAFRVPRKSKDEILKEEQKALEEMKESIRVFFKNYSSAIGQLRSSDRIAILIDLQDWTMTGSSRGFLTASTTKQDIERYRKDEINNTQFSNQIKFKVSNGDSEISNDIDIMTEIFERGMGTFARRERVSNNGIYLDGLGALFFVELPGFFITHSDENTSVVAVQEYSKALGYLYRADEEGDAEKSERKEEKEKWMKSLKDDLFELVSSYGHTLRIKPQESIVLNVNLGNRFNFWRSDESQQSNLILKLKKTDIDNYNKGGISLAGLRNKAVFRTF